MSKEARPLVTIVLFAYNSQEFVGDAVKGVLSQDYSPLEIILSDDGSTDDTYKIMEDIVGNYCGTHKIIVRKNDKNLGLTEHINKVWGMVGGEWLVVAAGDDVSHEGRVSEIMRQIEKHPEVKLITSYAEIIDINGSKLGVDLAGDTSKNPAPGSICIWDIKDRIQNSAPSTLGATFAYSRELIDLFPLLPAGCVFEDNIIGFRAELVGRCALIRAPLVFYRSHFGQTTKLNPNDLRAGDKKRIRNYSDGVLTVGQNVEDYERILMSKGKHGKFIGVDKWLSDKLRYYRILKMSLTCIWPIRIFPFIILLLQKHRFSMISRDLAFRIILPRELYFLLKRINIR